MEDDDEIQLEVVPADDGKTVTLVMTKAKGQISYGDFILELEMYLSEISRAESQKPNADMHH